jgi:transposase-like protein
VSPGKTAPAIITFSDTLDAAQKLNRGEQIRLVNTLRSLLFPNTYTNQDLAMDLREKRFHKGFVCPHCASDEVVKNGPYKERQRYKCNACRRTFNDLTGTPLAGTHLMEKWLEYIERMVKGLSLRKICDELEISLNTAFNWRHKVLEAFKKLEFDGFKGVLEVDETFILHNEKGNRNIVGRDPRKRGGKSPKRGISNDQDCILVAQDRTGRTIAQLACLGRISRKQTMAVLKDALDDVTVLCTDAHRTWRSVANAEGLKHIELNASKKERVRGLYHIQNANGFHSRLKRWLARFNGVASKFLDNYLVWFNFLDTHRMEASAAKRNGLILNACMATSPVTCQSIRNTEFKLPVHQPVNL